MASKNGPLALGSDGNDFVHRQKVAAQYLTSAVTKSRLKFCIFMHFLLFLIMCAKLAEDVLDSMDIFIMEIEQLEIPKPHRWEYIWATCLLFSFMGLSAIRRNRVGRMQFYIFGIFFGGLFPILYAAAYYFSEMWEYISTRDSSKLEKWQGYPLAVLWYIFIAAAFQVHVFSLYFAEQLVVAWKARGVKKVQWWIAHSNLYNWNKMTKLWIQKDWLIYWPHMLDGSYDLQSLFRFVLLALDNAQLW